MRMHSMLVIGMAFSAALVCQGQDKSPSVARPTAPSVKIENGVDAKQKARTDFPVVGYLEKRDRTITIKAGPKGPLYSIKRSDGKVLFENLSKEELRAKAPEIHEFIRTAFVGSGKDGAKLDARLKPLALR